MRFHLVQWMGPLLASFSCSILEAGCPSYGGEPVFSSEGGQLSIQNTREHKTENEDYGYSGEGLAMVADGMGGHRGGALASRKAGLALIEGIRDVHPGAMSEERLRGLFLEAGMAVYSAGQATGVSEMGTTLTAAVIIENKLIYAHVGDSELHLLRAGSHQRVTKHHTVFQELVDSGIPPEDIGGLRNTLSRVVSADKPLIGEEVDTGTITLQDGDQILMGSDGLLGKLEPHEILAQSHLPPDEALAKLAELARTRTRDDITGSWMKFIRRTGN